MSIILAKSSREQLSRVEWERGATPSSDDRFPHSSPQTGRASFPASGFPCATEVAVVSNHTACVACRGWARYSPGQAPKGLPPACVPYALLAFVVWTAFPSADYYASSVPPGRDRRSPRPSRRKRPGGSRVPMVFPLLL